MVGFCQLVLVIPCCYCYCIYNTALPLLCSQVICWDDQVSTFSTWWWRSISPVWADISGSAGELFWAVASPKGMLWHPTIKESLQNAAAIRAHCSLELDRVQGNYRRKRRLVDTEKPVIDSTPLPKRKRSQKQLCAIASVLSTIIYPASSFWYI